MKIIMIILLSLMLISCGDESDYPDHDDTSYEIEESVEAEEEVIDEYKSRRDICLEGCFADGKGDECYEICNCIKRWPGDECEWEY